MVHTSYKVINNQLITLLGNHIIYISAYVLVLQRNFLKIVILHVYGGFRLNSHFNHKMLAVDGSCYTLIAIHMYVYMHTSHGYLVFLYYINREFFVCVISAENAENVTQCKKAMCVCVCGHIKIIANMPEN